MRTKWHGGSALIVGSLLLAGMPLLLASAAAASTDIHKPQHSRVLRHNSGGVAVHSDAKHPLSKSGKARYAFSGGLQCVPFARAASGIALKGNAANWWDAAAGVYDRGSRPEPGSVLNFRATGGMRLGHVAVVTNVLGAREIEIDHANWSAFGFTKGNISRGMMVIDVSEANDWTQVRVELGHSQEFGSAYPTYGFIYDRPDSGHMLANTQDAPQDATSRAVLGFDEVAEAPPGPLLTRVSVPVDAPDHTLR
jgi:surface antigen